MMPFQLRHLSLSLSSALAMSAADGASTQSFASTAVLAQHLRQSVLIAMPSGIVRAVTTCSDDSMTAGTLRAAIQASGNGDTISLTTLPGADPACTDSSITLINGQISIPASRQLTIQGPTAPLSIVAESGYNRVFYAGAGSVVQINDLTLRGGRTTTTGGCIFSKGEIDLQHSTVTDCESVSSSKYAGGAGVYGKTVKLTQGSSVNGNTATVSTGSGVKFAIGGGVFATGEFDCTDSTVSGNQSTEGGGGVFLSQTSTNVSLTNCTVDSNTSGFGGGLLLYNASSSATIASSTISGNTATKGGGVDSKTALTLVNSTVAFNVSTGMYAGGIYSAASVFAESTIISKNISPLAGGMDLSLGSSAMLTGAVNLISSTNAMPNAGVITVTADPQLAPLGNHGGPTRTHALLAMSPALDNGDDTQGYPYDQRGTGFARVVHGQADIGAYERQTIDDEIFANGFE